MQFICGFKKSVIIPASERRKVQARSELHVVN